MNWQEFLATYETHDSSFERIESINSQKQYKLHLQVQPLYDLEKNDTEDHFIVGQIVGFNTLQFSINPAFDFVDNDFDGEILRLSINICPLDPECLKLFVAFLVFDYSTREHTFHTLEMIAKDFIWMPSDS